MKKIIISVIAILFLHGCSEKDPVPCVQDTSVVKTTCPRFSSSINIKVEDLNSTHGAVSWKDVTKLEGFIKSKKTFNSKVDKLNLK